MTTMTTVNVGDKVTFRHEKWGGTLTGKVVEVSPTKATVSVRRTAGNWTVPHGHFRIALERLTVVPLIDPRDHSAKGLDTFAAMGTKPSDWGLADIKWETRLVKMTVWVKCPKCRLEGKVWKFGDKLVGHNELQKYLKEKFSYGVERVAKERGGVQVTCPECPMVKWTRKERNYLMEDGGWSRHDNGHQFGYSTTNGLVKAERNVEREVGVVQWAAGTSFDSRFTEWSHCQLCAKAIPSRRFVPVTGKGADGRIHGMYVGEDCARKFMGIKNFRENQTVERPA